MSSVFDQLLDMGFSRFKAEKAISLSSGIDLESVMNWLVDHEKELDDETEGNLDTVNVVDLTAKSFVCEDCKKHLRSDNEVELHSARTGHVNYAESSEEIKALNEDEKKQQLDKLQDLLKSKRVLREEQEKHDEIVREKNRRMHGKDLGSIRSKAKDDELRRLMEERKREKEEDKIYREKLKEAIARERKEKRDKELGLTNNEVKSLPIFQPTPQITSSDNAVCRLQIRFPSGSPIISEFNSDDTFDKVMTSVRQDWESQFGALESQQICLFTNFPRREFSEQDGRCSLSELGLCPSSVVFVRKINSVL